MSKYSNKHEQIIDAIKTLEDCIDKQCLGQGDQDALVVVLKELVSKEWDVYYAIKESQVIDKAITKLNKSKQNA